MMVGSFCKIPQSWYFRILQIFVPLHPNCQNEEKMKKTLLWIGALVVGAILGLLGLDWLNGLMDFVATV